MFGKRFWVWSLVVAAAASVYWYRSAALEDDASRPSCARAPRLSREDRDPTGS